MYCSKLQFWSQQGAFAELPTELSQHVQQCKTCSQFLAEVTLARRWVEKANVHRVSAQRLDNIEVLLRAEARFTPGLSHSEPQRKWWFMGAAAVVLLGTAGAAAAWVSRRPTPATPTTQAAFVTPQVIIALAPGARGHSDSSAPQTTYLLEQGEGEFDVGRLPNDGLFYVNGANFSVAAKKSHFRVQVSDGKVTQLSVTAGHVTVHREGSPRVTLGAGQTLNLQARDDQARPSEPVLHTQAAPEAAASNAPGPLVSAGRVPARLATSDGANSTAKALPQAQRPAARSTPDDSAFASAFAKLDAGRAREAAASFDELLSHGNLDPSRRSDVLYWSSQAHARAGNRTLAENRAFAYVSSYPSSLHAADAALLLGDYARDKGQFNLARRYYAQAAASTRPSTAARAKQAMSQLLMR